MRKWMLLGMAAAAIAPNIASAQGYRDGREDRREIRQDRRELREDRRDLRDDRARHWAHDDWRAYRERNRVLYARGDWRAPYRYVPFRVGVRIAPAYYGPRVVIAEPWRYHLPPVGRYQTWVRHYDDVLLVDTRRGVVVDVYRGFFI